MNAKLRVALREYEREMELAIPEIVCAVQKRAALAAQARMRIMIKLSEKQNAR